MNGKRLENKIAIATGVGTGTAGGIPGDQLALASLPRTVQFQITWRY